LKLDKSNDIKDNPEVAVFVRYISIDMTVNEQL